jgi:hypothetical protein
MPYKGDEESTILAKPHKEVRCREVEYELCEKDNRKVPVVLVRKLYVPKFGRERIVVKDNEGKVAKLCTDVIGWKLCSTDRHTINGILTEKIYGPHFINKCEDRKKIYHDDHDDDDEETEVDVKIKKTVKKNKKYDIDY